MTAAPRWFLPESYCVLTLLTIFSTLAQSGKYMFNPCVKIIFLEHAYPYSSQILK